jgi:Uma2 family endonuclease
MGERALQRMTVEEFLRWEGEPDVRYELIDGRPVAMNPPRGFHRTIAINVGGLLWSRLRERRVCRAESEAGIELQDGNYYVADLAVTCAGPANAASIEQPALIVEILSRGPRADDLGGKIPAYQDIASVQEIWAIDSERRRIWVYRREGERWVIDRCVGSASFTSAVVEGDFALDDIYENTDL